MSSRLCPSCGAAYVDAVVSCPDCGVALVDLDALEDPRQLPEEEQLVYELASWTLDQRTEVAEVMADSGIPHAWEGDELFVHVQFEDVVDRLIEPIEHATGAAVLAVGELPEGELTEYDLTEWTPGARQAVAEQLAADEIPFGWDGTKLLVAVADEEDVDEVLDELEESGALDDADDASEEPGEETPGQVLEQLFLAADRLRKDALDADGLRGLADAMTLVVPGRPPYGLDPLAWRRITAVAEDLVAAVTGEDDGDDEVADDTDVPATEALATDLRELLRDYV